MKRLLKRNFIFLTIIILVLTIFSPIAIHSIETKAATTPAYMPIGSNFWFLNPSWSGEIPMKSGINWTTAYTNGDDIWNPIFIEELKPYINLRFMDWGQTNNSIVTSWASRRLPNDSNNYEPQGKTGAGGLAYEWMIDLCNRTNKDFWVCIPHQANDDYVQNLAQLIKTKLNPGLKCYLEYSNEVWNSDFQQSAYATAQGKAKGFQYDNSMYYTYRSFQMFKIFSDVFGSEMSSRVVRTCCFSGYLDLFGFGYGMIKDDKKLNPYSQKADLFAVAPYVGSGLDGSAANIVSSFHKEIDTKVTTYIADAARIAKSYGVPLATYEGGQHLLKNAQVFSSNPLIYDEYLYMLQKFSPYFIFFTHYNHCGRAASGGAWGSKTGTGQNIAQAHKYRALVDWSHSLVKPSPTPDNSKPIISVNNYIKAFTNKSITVYAAASKGVLNKTSFTFQKNGSFAFIATDSLGNVGIKLIEIKNIDKILPKIIIKNAAGKIVLNYKSTKGLVSILVSDKNLKSKTLYRNGIKMAWPTGSKTKLLGSYQVIAKDKAGNISKCNFKIYN